MWKLLALVCCLCLSSYKVAAEEDPACKLESTSWKPKASTPQVVEGDDQLRRGTSVNEADSIDLRIHASCGAGAPEYAAVRLSPPSGKSSMVLLKADSSSKTLHKATVNMADIKDKGLEFEVTIFVGGKGAAPVASSIGSFSVVSPGKAAAVAKATSKRDEFYAPLPAILHMHRLPQNSPMPLVPLAGTAAVLAALLMWAGLLRLTGANVDNFPKDTASRLVCVLFQLALAAVLLLGVYFWMRLSFVALVTPLSIVGTVCVLLGYRALRALAHARVKQAAGAHLKSS